MKKLAILFLASCFCFNFGAKAQEKTANQYANLPVIGYCEIIKNPEIYKDKIVKLFAVHSVGFEFSGFGSNLCSNDYGKIWAEWEKFESCGDEKTARLSLNRYKGIEYNSMEGNFVGKFLVKEEGKSGFGHMNVKPFKLIISCVENATLLPKENSGCRRVDETSPFHYLEYVKTEIGVAPDYENNRKKRKQEKLVWFRLVNNSSCPIIVPTLENGAEELQDKAEASVIYKLDPTIRTWHSSLLPTNGKIRIITTAVPKRSILSGGNSIYFAVPLRYFTESYKVRGKTRGVWNISIPFEYADRKAENNYDPFYFAQTDLPKEIFKK